MSEAAAIILAAGKSTRMKSDLPKVLHEVCGRPMLAGVLDACEQAGVTRTVVVVGHGRDAVIAAFADREGITWVEQPEQKGTGHAALVCEPALSGYQGPTLVIAGDMPLIRSCTVEKLLEQHSATGDGVTLATSIFDDPAGYGRIARDDRGRLSEIVEEVDCTLEQRRIKEVNISYYCFDTRCMFEALHQVTPDNAKGEYYITDAVRILLRNGHGAGAVPAVDPCDAMGINSRADLARVNAVMQDRIQQDWMCRGVTIIDTANTWIDAQCEIGADTTIHPFSRICRGSRIGQGCQIGPFALIMEDEPVVSGGVVGPVALAKAIQP